MKFISKIFKKILLHFIETYVPVWGKQNKIKCGKKSKNGIRWDIKGNCNQIRIGDFCLIKDLTIHIRGNNCVIEIGNSVRINGGELWIEDNDCTIIVGSFSTIESAHIAVTEPNSKVIIGQDCMFASGIQIRTGDSHSIIDRLSNKRINYAKDIVIKNHVWLGNGATILKGAVISENSIVALGAVITKFVPPNCIVGGIPTKIIKENIEWKRERIYE